MRAWHGLLAVGALVSSCGRSSLLFDVREDDDAASGAGALGTDAARGGAAGTGSSAAGRPTGYAGDAGAPSGGSPGAGAAGASGAAPDPACDRDRDGHRDETCGGDDCNDRDPSVHGDAPDTNAELGAFSTEYVYGDLLGDFGKDTKIAVDAAGGVHITEGSAGLRYATNESGAWVSEIVDLDSVGTPSLALSRSGTVNIAYNTASEVRLAIRGKSRWSSERVLSLNPGGEFRGGESSLAIEPDGPRHLVYGASGLVQYVIESEETWTVVGSFTASNDPKPALALDSTGVPHILFRGPDATPGLVYATRCGQVPCVLELAHGEMMSSDIAVDGNDRVHAVYALLELDSPLTHAARQSDGVWRMETVHRRSSWTVDLQASKEGSSALLELAMMPDFRVTYARREADGWVDELVNPDGRGVSIAPEGSSFVHLAFTGFAFDVNTYVAYATNRLLAPDGIDQNCDGVDGVDRDGDGHAAPSTGGTDCDDRNAAVHPGSADRAGDGLDSDCDGDDDDDD